MWKHRILESINPFRWTRQPATRHLPINITGMHVPQTCCWKPYTISIFTLLSRSCPRSTIPVLAWLLTPRLDLAPAVCAESFASRWASATARHGKRGDTLRVKLKRTFLYCMILHVRTTMVFLTASAAIEL